MATKKAGRTGIDNYNHEQVVELLTLAKGERSFREYALDAGVSAANLYRIKKNDYKPSPQMLKTLTSEKAAPRGSVTFEDLMIAAGYQDQDSIEIAKEEIVLSSGDESDEVIISRVRNEERRKLREEMRARERSFIMTATGLIYRTLGEKKMDFSHLSPEQLEEEMTHGMHPDIMISINKNGIKEWWIDFKYLDERRTSEIEDSRVEARFPRGRFFLRRVKEMIFGKLMFVPPKADRKISIVLNNEDFYEYMAKYKDKISYRGDLSIILVDIDTFSILEETYLSRYEEQGRETEFYF